MKRLSTQVKDKIREHVRAGFRDADVATALNLDGLKTAKDTAFTQQNVAYYRARIGLKKPGGVYKPRKMKQATSSTTLAPKKASPAPHKLRDVIAAILDCAPAQRKERIDLVFKLLEIA